MSFAEFVTEPRALPHVKTGGVNLSIFKLLWAYAPRWPLTFWHSTMENGAQGHGLYKWEWVTRNNRLRIMIVYWPWWAQLRAVKDFERTTAMQRHYDATFGRRSPLKFEDLDDSGFVKPFKRVVPLETYGDDSLARRADEL